MKATKLIPGFPGYCISKSGNVWTCWERKYQKGVVGSKYILGLKWMKMKSSPMPSGYMQVQLYRDGKAFHQLVHRLVLLAFVGPCPKGMEAAHENGKRLDCRLSNLSWKTKSANQMDRLRHGTDCRGEKHGIAVLTNAQAREAIAMYERMKSYTEVGKLFGVTRHVISRLVKRHTYKNLR